MKLKVLSFTLITVLFLFILAYCIDGSLVTIGFFIFIIGTLGYICFKLNDIHKELRKLTDPNGEIEKAKKEKFFTTPEGEVLPSFLKKSEEK
ncbi:hypothetical protein [Eubacterium sp.]|uniref:hypothetical protein n=1 Tax=Eubacterium sp. TaxID=142586 RepID=UPI0025F1811C|nr:hypothetical protein [Eubacterium sp.]MCR5630121.1 hypothetical protein [Eubacterium sp.]